MATSIYSKLKLNVSFVIIGSCLLAFCYLMYSLPLVLEPTKQPSRHKMESLWENILNWTFGSLKFTEKEAPDRIFT